jgi:Delta7-sterol 5-desaturase
VTLTASQIVVIVTVAALGHVMALVWYLADKLKWKVCKRAIYDLPVRSEQLRRELINSVHTPMHALVLGAFIAFGYFENTSLTSFLFSGILTTAWAEIWHYASHRALHMPRLHWIHVEHHKSRINTPFTAISFSFTEKLVFDIGLLVPLAALDHVVSLNAYGVAAWFVGYLIINSFSHANFEIKSKHYNRFLGKVLTTTTYHSLHHARYTGNYGLATRFLDRIFKTEWPDYGELYDQICDSKPLRGLRETTHHELMPAKLGSS